MILHLNQVNNNVKSHWIESLSSQDVLFGALEDECDDGVGFGRLPLARVQHDLVTDDGRRHGGEQEPGQILLTLIWIIETFVGVLIKENYVWSGADMKLLVVMLSTTSFRVYW